MKICFHGAIVVLMYTSVTGFILQTRQVLATWPVTLFGPAFHRREWSSFCPLGYFPAEDSADGIAKVVYTSKDRKSRKVFNALDWLDRLTTHIPGRYEQTVRYYGWYSNKSRGMRKKTGTDDTIPAVMPNDMSSKESRQNWARLIQKIYAVDPLVCPKCQGSMKIIAFIEELDVIEKILRHLDLWDIHNHDPPQNVSDYILELVCA